MLYLGRLDHQKGIERLLGCVRLLRATGTRVQWRMIGGEIIDAGQSSNWTEKLRAERVQVDKPLYAADALAQAMSEADVLVLPSRWEGVPLVILEAQRLGCVPVATEVGAVREVVSHGVDGMLVPDGADAIVAEALATTLRMLADDRARLMQIAERGARRAGTLNWHSSAAPFLAVLRDWFPPAEG
ncbi:MAG: glycosyltransferase family 4 protein [Acetobacteraceae bacterium]